MKSVAAGGLSGCLSLIQRKAFRSELAYHYLMNDTELKVSEIMTTPVVGVSPDASLLEMTGLMVQKKISGLPVVNSVGELVGIVTEGDCLRRAELGTEQKDAGWKSFLASTQKLADNYVRSHGRKVSEIMTAQPITVDDSASLADVVALMERHKIKRMPVTRDGRLVGIVSRSNIVEALMSKSLHMPAADESDEALRREIRKTLDALPWVRGLLIEVRVIDKVAELRGVVGLDTIDAIVVAVENVPGIRKVRNLLACLDPVSGIVFDAGGKLLALARNC